MHTANQDNQSFYIKGRIGVTTSRFFPTDSSTKPFLVWCLKELHQFYNTKSKVKITPWDPDNTVDIDKIYIPLSMLRDDRNPRETAKEKLEDYAEMFKGYGHHPNPKRILVYGKPGIGKSTFTQKIAVDWARGEKEILKKFDVLLSIKLRDVCDSRDFRTMLETSELLSTDFKIKRRKRPCAYYSNSTATFHCLLVGGLVFKLNPGPENNDNLSTLCSHGIRKTPPSMRSRNPSNFTVVNRLPLVKNVKRPLSFCLMNARSVRNKSADIFDFVCEYKIDLLAITETWLNANDDAVRNELCPTNYKLYDHPRTDRVGGGTALIYRDLLHVKKISAGVKESFEFSELIVQQPSSHNLRVIILYRPPSSDVRRVYVHQHILLGACRLLSLLYCVRNSS